MLLYAGALPDLYAINIVRIGSATESVHGGGVVFREACGNKRFIRCVLPPDIPSGDYDNAEHNAGRDFQDQLHLNAVLPGEQAVAATCARRRLSRFW